MRNEDWGLRTKDWRLRIEDRGLRTEDWGLKSEDWGLRTEDWGQPQTYWGHPGWPLGPNKFCWSSQAACQLGTTCASLLKELECSLKKQNGGQATEWIAACTDQKLASAFIQVVPLVYFKLHWLNTSGFWTEIDQKWNVIHLRRDRYCWNQSLYNFSSDFCIDSISFEDKYLKKLI